MTPSFRQVATYDFRGCPRLSLNQMNAHRLIQEVFAANATEALSALFGSKTLLTLECNEQHPLAYIQRSLIGPACWARIDLQPIPGFATLIIDGSIAYSVISKMLGGDAEPPAHIHPFTNLEMAVNRKFINVLLKQLRSAWQQIAEMSFTIDEMGSDLPKILDRLPSEICTASYFKTSFPHATGYIVLLFNSLCFNSLRSQLEVLSASSTFMPPPPKIEYDHLEIEMKALLGTLYVSKEEISQLQPGDILDLQQSANEPIDIMIANERVFKGHPGLAGKNKGVVLLPTQQNTLKE